MTGQEYLEDIRTNLKSGRNQHRMGEKILRAFGYVRRRATAIEEINATLEELGLLADPPVNSEMPLRIPRIRFILRATADAMTSALIARPRWIPGGATLHYRMPKTKKTIYLNPLSVFPNWRQQTLWSNACPLVLRSRLPILRCSFENILNWWWQNTRTPCKKTSRGPCRSNRLRRP